MERLDCFFALLGGSAAEEDVVGFFGREEGFDSFEAKATVAASDENNLWGCHC